MPPQWTGDIVRDLHLYGITRKRLAAHLGMTADYINAILNGRRCPAGAEQRFRAALIELIASDAPEA